MIEELVEQLEENECLLADGYEAALIGITEGANPVAVYNSDLCVECLMKQGMTREDAVEWFYYNTIGVYAGEKTPVFLKTY